MPVIIVHYDVDRFHTVFWARYAAWPRRLVSKSYVATFGHVWVASKGKTGIIYHNWCVLLSYLRYCEINRVWRWDFARVPSASATQTTRTFLLHGLWRAVSLLCRYKVYRSTSLALATVQRFLKPMSFAVISCSADYVYSPDSHQIPANAIQDLV